MEINNIEKIEVSEKSVQSLVNWLSEKYTHALEDYNLSDLVRYLLREVESLKTEIEQLKNK